MPRCAHTHHGFTLIELMVTLAISGILATIGVPSMTHLLARVQNSGAETAIAGSLRHARTVAVMHETRVLVCPSADGHHCQAADEWQHGWILAQDRDHDGQPDAGIPIIVAHATLHGGARVITSVGREKVAFHPDGGAAGSNATFTICHAREHDGKSVVVSNTGRVRVENATSARLQACLEGIRTSEYP